jgi:hypothetical protein
MEGERESQLGIIQMDSSGKGQWHLPAGRWRIETEPSSGRATAIPIEPREIEVSKTRSTTLDVLPIPNMRAVHVQIPSTSGYYPLMVYVQKLKKQRNAEFEVFETVAYVKPPSSWLWLPHGVETLHFAADGWRREQVVIDTVSGRSPVEVRLAPRMRWD